MSVTAKGYMRFAKMSGKLGITVLGLWLGIGCQTEPRPLLYPTQAQAEVEYLCRVVYDQRHSLNKQWYKAIPEMITVFPHEVTVYFANQQSITIPREGKTQLLPGSYRCRWPYD